MGLALALVAGALVVLTTGDGGEVAEVRTAPAQAPVPELEWERCDAGPEGDECATALVPVDHADPEGSQLELALRRVPATGDPDERIGTLFMNPGGPGASGADMVAQYGPQFSPEVRAAFDLVGWAPRGVVGSYPAIPCEPDVEDTYPAGDPVDWSAYFGRTSLLAAESSTACQVALARTGPYYGTNAVAEDLDLLRQAVGDEALNYWGVSYGTRIGEVYAQRHPDRIRAMVLDGNVDPWNTLVTYTSERAGGFDDAFGFFLDQYPGLEADFEVVRAALAEGPLDVVSATTGEPTELTEDTFLGGVIMGIISSEALWGTLAAQIANLADQVLDAGPPTTVLIVEQSANGVSVNIQVNCLDLPGRPDVAEMAAVASEMEVEGPLFGRYVAGGLASCSGFPLPVDAVPADPPPADELPPILLLASVHDPSTAYPWAAAMRSLLAGSEIVTYEGVQHGVWNYASECVNDAADAYVLELVMPEPGTVCPFVPPPAPPEEGAPSSVPSVFTTP